MHDALRCEDNMLRPPMRTALADGDALATALRAHLDHKEAEGLVLIESTLTEEQWQAFGTEHGRRIAGDVQRYLPWVLEGATPDVVTAVLGRFSLPLQRTYREQWQPVYAMLPLWT